MGRRARIKTKKPQLEAEAFFIIKGDLLDNSHKASIRSIGLSTGHYSP
ncbi:hypothetical protein HNQ93_000199 [Hymenobacter luteus]|uniref:Uncharacterized protein n=2 Tax=Hymenobacter TaxID=89966 RepID=A0A7W9W981_9BACT|nr:hypothetical protein [Hymenobacter latericoloratus]MBB6057369.1 hypothetical protein [Hymenobacter luteus]